MKSSVLSSRGRICSKPPLEITSVLSRHVQNFCWLSCLVLRKQAAGAAVGGRWHETCFDGEKTPPNQDGQAFRWRLRIAETVPAGGLADSLEALNLINGL